MFTILSKLVSHKVLIQSNIIKSGWFRQLGFIGREKGWTNDFELAVGFWKNKPVTPHLVSPAICSHFISVPNRLPGVPNQCNEPLSFSSCVPSLVLWFVMLPDLFAPLVLVSCSVLWRPNHHSLLCFILFLFSTCLCSSNLHHSDFFNQICSLK